MKVAFSCAVLATVLATAYAQDPNLAAPGPNDIGLSQVDPSVPGNPCLTGRNNGEFVFATCTLEAVDRRFVQDNVDGQPALTVRREYDANFPGGEGAINAQLAGGENCLGIRPDGLLSAVPCSQGNNARLEDGEIRIGNECITGGINQAPLSGQVTIGTNNCAKFTTVQA